MPSSTASGASPDLWTVSSPDQIQTPVDLDNLVGKRRYMWDQAGSSLGGGGPPSKQATALVMAPAWLDRLEQMYRCLVGGFASVRH